jgi:DNA-binding XRE family transcriptional regulator
MRKGTHTPKGDEVRRLRAQRGWTQDEFADEAGVGKRTVERIEKGMPTTLTVLKLVAEALSVQVGVILGPPVNGLVDEKSVGDDPGAEVAGNPIQGLSGGSEVAVVVGAQGVQIRFPDDFDTWNLKRQRQVMAAIAQLLGVSVAALFVQDVAKGSVLLTLGLTPEQAEKLLWAVKRGDLGSIGAEDATLVPINPAGPDEGPLDEVPLDEALAPEHLGARPLSSLDDPVTVWLCKLKAGSQSAVQPLWEAYFQRLVNLARQYLRGTSRAVADEEDVALSAFDTFCRGVAEGRFPHLEDSGDLWQVLIVLTAREARKTVRHERMASRGGGRVVHASALEGEGEDEANAFAELMGREATPELAAQIADQYRDLQGRLEPVLREVAVAKMEGLTNAEIARQLGCSRITVERHLRRIRATWEQRGG